MYNRLDRPGMKTGRPNASKGHRDPVVMVLEGGASHLLGGS